MIHAHSCTRCEALTKTRRKIVWGQGPTPCRLLFLGEAPGTVEDRMGMPFHDRAPAGGEFNHMLWRRGISREMVYVTNLIKCHPPDDRDPTPEEVANCNYWLMADLAACRPSFIITLGRPATRRFLGDVDMEDVHGIPYHVNVDGLGQVVVIPCYHPAAGLHQPQTAIMVNDDLTAVADIIKGRRPTTHILDAFPSTDYRETDDPDEIVRDLCVDAGEMIGLDTESVENGKRAWSVQYSTRPGMGRFVRADNSECMTALAIGVSDPNRVIGIANALYDLPILDALDIRPARPVDTMLMAYLLQNQPQGLKPLAYRHCGMTMLDYSSLVAEDTHLKSMQFLARAVEMEWPDPAPVLTWDKGRPHIKQPQNIGRKIASILTSVSKYLWEDVAPEKRTNPRQRWMTIELDEGRGMVEEKLGEMPMGDLRGVPFELALWYACRDPDATLRIYPHLWSRIVENDLEDTFWADMGAMAMVSDMMIAGFKGNPDAFRRLSAYLQDKYDETIAKMLRQLAGIGVHLDYFNPQSPPQTHSLLYNKLELGKHLRGVKGEGSTDDKILSRLVEMRKVIGEEKAQVVISIQDARGYRKLKGTYADPIPLLLDSNSRVHTTFRVTRTTTGRMSATRPNLLAQPVRSEDGRKLRDCYEAEDGCTLLSADYSQIELRVLAHCSGDEKMISIFRRGLDLHAQTASEAFGIPINQLDDHKHRRPAKTLNFGIAYGMGPEGLQGALATMGLDWSLNECDRFILEWFRLFPGVRGYMNGIHSHVLQYGWVADMFGRRRYLPHANAKSKKLRAEALREAGNHPIQAGAQGIIKRAMRELVPVYRDFRRQGVIWNPLLQIHDSLENEVGDADLPLVTTVLLHIMENAVKLKVPVKVDAKTGKTWGSMSKWKEAA